MTWFLEGGPQIEESISTGPTQTEDWVIPGIVIAALLALVLLGSIQSKMGPSLLGWLERRRKLEAARIRYQNERSISYLKSYLQGDQRTVARLRELETLVSTTSDVRAHFDANRELRRLYARTPSQQLQSFDTRFSRRTLGDAA